MQSFEIATVSAVIMAIAMVLWASLARPLRLLDAPDGVRKHHEGLVPLAGGPALFTVLLIISATLPVVPLDWRFLLTAAAAVTLGALDDRFDLSATLRLGVQLIIGALVVTTTGSVLTNLGDLAGTGVAFDLGVSGPWITIAALAAAMNAFNMLDGTDGQAAGVGMVALGGLIAAAALAGQAPAPAVVAIAAALPVFLVFNLAGNGGALPKCFLGDSGALLLGLFVGCALIDSAMAEAAIIRPVTVLWFAALPLFDTFFVMGYRALHGRSPLSADRNHVHHLLVDHGLTKHQGLAAVLAAASLLAAIGLALDLGGLPDAWSFFGVLTLFCCYVGAALSLHRRRPESEADLSAPLAR